MGPDPAVAAVRLAVRRALHQPTEQPTEQSSGQPSGQPSGDDGVPGTTGTVMVACSGGPDSLALLAAAVFERRRSGVKVVGAVVDHALQEGSGERTERVVAQMARLGVDETATIRVRVDPGPRGLEAGAREARYAALSQLAEHLGADRVLLGHTVDDQAESVLLGLTQGSGPRSLSGMRDAFRPQPGAGHVFVRPLLRAVTRAQTRAACRAEDIDWWDDPHNEDPRFTRSRVRHRVMPLLERELGPGVAAALARTGHLVRDDLDALDDEAEALLDRHPAEQGLDVALVEPLHHAVRTRVLRLAALRAGALPRDLTHGHVAALEEMLWRRRGEPRDLDLPGHVRAERRDDVIRFVATSPPGGPAVAG